MHLNSFQRHDLRLSDGTKFRCPRNHFDVPRWRWLFWLEGSKTAGDEPDFGIQDTRLCNMSLEQFRDKIEREKLKLKRKKKREAREI